MHLVCLLTEKLLNEVSVTNTTGGEKRQKKKEERVSEQST